MIPTSGIAQKQESAFVGCLCMCPGDELVEPTSRHEQLVFRRTPGTDTQAAGLSVYRKAQVFRETTAMNDLAAKPGVEDLLDRPEFASILDGQAHREDGFDVAAKTLTLTHGLRKVLPSPRYNRHDGKQKGTLTTVGLPKRQSVVDAILNRVHRVSLRNHRETPAPGRVQTRRRTLSVVLQRTKTEFGPGSGAGFCLAQRKRGCASSDLALVSFRHFGMPPRRPAPPTYPRKMCGRYTNTAGVEELNARLRPDPKRRRARAGKALRPASRSSRSWPHTASPKCACCAGA
jgi:hypothetical protein